LPEEGWTKEQIMARMQMSKDYSRKCISEYKHSGAAYTGDEKHWKLIADVMGMNIMSNTIHIDQFKYVGQMEAEIIRMMCNLMNGDEETCGLGTSGGSEGLVLAMLAYRE
jgi:glutamate/tyrosine decarboxylase-like PLP-dependent enzyme